MFAHITIVFNEFSLFKTPLCWATAEVKWKKRKTGGEGKKDEKEEEKKKKKDKTVMKSNYNDAPL